jgi:PmbA protein
MSVQGKRVALEGSELERIVRFVLDEAVRIGADQAEATASHDVGLSVTARLGDVENLEYTNDRGVGITLYAGSRKGSAGTSDFNPKSLREAVAKARSFARYTEPDPYAGLADADRMAKDPPDLHLAHPWEIDSTRAIELAVACEAAALAFDPRIRNSEGATVATHAGARAYGNTHSFLASYPGTRHSVSCTVVGEADGAMERDYHYSTARDAEDLEGAESIGRTAARRAIARLGARKINTARAPVLFAPEVARGFIGHAIAAISGGAQYRRASFLLEGAGEQIFPDFLTIEERPHLPGGLASAPFDSEGVATRDRDLVAGGVLQGYMLSTYSARRLGLATTGNAGGAHNLILPGNAEDLAELIGTMGQGLVVHELIGQGVNGVTGDYSRGTVGFWVENGEIAWPVHEVTIAGNLRDLYRRIAAIGRDQDLRGAIRCGSLLVEGMTIAGS